jgi:hypothetical protein
MFIYVVLRLISVCYAMTVSSQDIYKEPRTVLLEKTDTGFGFNVRGQVNEGGQLKSIGGKLYGPLQHVSAVLSGGAAERVGVRPGDRILAVNGERVEGATHAQVVNLIRQGGDSLSLTLLSVPPGEAARLDPDDDQFYDYSDRAPLNVKIPSFTYSGDGSFVQFHIHLDDELCSLRRYSEFVALQAQLQRLFPDLITPQLPGKWFFKMSNIQLQKRRAGLETWLQEVLSVRVVHNAAPVELFLQKDGKSPVNSVFQRQILLPDLTFCPLSGQTTVSDALENALKRINLTTEWGAVLQLYYQDHDGVFCRLNRPEAIPDKNELFLRLFLFSPVLLEILLEDKNFRKVVSLLAAQGTDNAVVKERLNVASDNLTKLIEEVRDESNDLKMLGQCFPPVGCDRRAPPAKVGINIFRDKMEINAYSGDTAEGNRINLEWSEVQNIKCEKDGLQIVYLRKESEKSLKAYLVQADQAEDSYQRVKTERKVEEQLPEQPLPESVLRLLTS